ncbi:immunoglobulin domain-containing protein [Ketobacter alkanivorans]|uniref:Ig-like domain-containing protein n=1 Tax=Ketobacter alkanivorans TaxID=1917421 RepID=A0A2K9LQ60_9GAMM|nr:immunoglobulin domain-containing protein [Ketobacter alkanivorans]AUM13615.1 hypothetical protein Kalk_14815 [Ketobacter alkanivorans]
MSVSALVNSLNSNNVIAAVVMAFALTLTGCGAGGETSDPAAQVVDSTTGGEDETNNGGNTDPIEEPVEETHVLNLITQPSNATITEGESHTFSVAVEHDLPITVTWYRNGSIVQSSSSTSLAATTAGTYDCAVTNGTDTLGCDSFTLTVNVLQFVTITSQPSNQMVNEGVDVTLSVGATGTGVLSYQWYFEGAPISGATGSSLVLDAVTLQDDGDYHVVVSNTGTSTTSSVVSVDVAANAVSGSALISWDRPQSRTDNSALSAGEIDAYEIYYSESANGSMVRLDSVDASESTYTVDGLSEGTHYFSLMTVDSTGMKSDYSTVVSVTIN